MSMTFRIAHWQVVPSVEAMRNREGILHPLACEGKDRGTGSLGPWPRPAFTAFIRDTLALHSILIRAVAPQQARAPLSGECRKRVIMARCSVCGAETRLYVSGVPLCNACSDALAAETKKLETKTGASQAIPDQPTLREPPRRGEG
jgi:hypothetical protein